MSQRELARQMERPYQSVNQILKDKKAVTAETAIDLERVFGGNAETWLNLRLAYDLTLARQRRAASETSSGPPARHGRPTGSRAASCLLRWTGNGEQATAGRRY